MIRALVFDLGDVAAAFDRCVCSWELRAVKPQRVAFLRLAAAIGYEPAELLFVDDSAANVAGARAAGLDAIAFVDARDLEHELDRRELVVPGSRR